MCLQHLIFYRLVKWLYVSPSHRSVGLSRVLSLLGVLPNWLIKSVLKQNSVESNCDKVSPWLCLSENIPGQCLSAVSAASASEQPLLLPLEEWDGTDHLLPMVTTKTMPIRQQLQIIYFYYHSCYLSPVTSESGFGFLFLHFKRILGILHQVIKPFSCIMFYKSGLLKNPRCLFSVWHEIQFLMYLCDFMICQIFLLSPNSYHMYLHVNDVSVVSYNAESVFQHKPCRCFLFSPMVTVFLLF